MNWVFVIAIILFLSYFWMIYTIYTFPKWEPTNEEERDIDFARLKRMSDKLDKLIVEREIEASQYD